MCHRRCEGREVMFQYGISGKSFVDSRNSTTVDIFKSTENRPPEVELLEGLQKQKATRYTAFCAVHVYCRARFYLDPDLWLKEASYLRVKLDFGGFRDLS